MNIVSHNPAQSSYDNIPSYPLDNDCVTNKNKKINVTPKNTMKALTAKLKYR